MPKIVLKEEHFMFLRTLVDEFLAVGEEEDDDDTPADVLNVAREVKILLNYTRYFKYFSVAIAEEEDGDSES